MSISVIIIILIIILMIIVIVIVIVIVTVIAIVLVIIITVSTIVCVYVCIYKCVRARVCVRACMCVYIYIYIYTYIYIYICVCVYVFVRPLLSRLQVIPKFCKTVITSESSFDQSRKRRKRLLTSKQPNMASGAPTIPASGIPVGADALMGATAEPPNAVRAAPTTGESPQAKRPSKRETAPSAPAATQDMTTAELTHAVQGILSQQDRDGRWMEVIRDVVEDHAKRLDDEVLEETDEHHHPGDSGAARGGVH
jgi:hypothetical protein